MLIEVKTPKLLADLPDGGEGWTVHYALFARQAFTDATRELAAEGEFMLLTLPQMEAALGDY